MQSVLIGSEYPVMDTLLFYVENGETPEMSLLTRSRRHSSLTLCSVSRAMYCFVMPPVPPYTVKAAYQHHIHLSGKNGLHHLLQSRTVKGHSRAVLGGSTNDGVPGLFRIAAKFSGLPFQRKAIIVSDAAIEIGFHRVVLPILQPVPGRS